MCNYNAAGQYFVNLQQIKYRIRKNIGEEINLAN